MERLIEIQNQLKKEIIQNQIKKFNTLQYGRKLTSIGEMIERLRLQLYIFESNQATTKNSPLKHLHDEIVKFDQGIV